MINARIEISTNWYWGFGGDYQERLLGAGIYEQNFKGQL